jgi:hypothetical protein
MAASLCGVGARTEWIHADRSINCLLWLERNYEAFAGVIRAMRDERRDEFAQTGWMLKCPRVRSFDRGSLWWWPLGGKKAHFTLCAHRLRPPGSLGQAQCVFHSIIQPIIKNHLAFPSKTSPHSRLALPSSSGHRQSNGYVHCQAREWNGDGRQLN